MARFFGSFQPWRISCARWLRLVRLDGWDPRWFQLPRCHSIRPNAICEDSYFSHGPSRIWLSSCCGIPLVGLKLGSDACGPTWLTQHLHSCLCSKDQMFIDVPLIKTIRSFRTVWCYVSGLAFFMSQQSEGPHDFRLCTGLVNSIVLWPIRIVPISIPALLPNQCNLCVCTLPSTLTTLAWSWITKGWTQPWSGVALCHMEAWSLRYGNNTSKELVFHLTHSKGCNML